MEKTELGLTGLQVSPLCFGTGTNGWRGRSNQGDLGIDKLAHLLRFAHERGVTFWDTADQYGTHPHVAAALKGVDRETTTLTTKTVSTDPEDVRGDVERYLHELGTDYIDILLFHCLTDPRWPEKMQGAMEVLSAFKEEGKIRAAGVSCHNFGAFATAAETDWVDVVLARINYAGDNMDETPEKVAPLIAKMAAAGKGIYGMKVLGGGNKLTENPGKGIRFTCGLTGIHAIVIGMMSEEEIRQNVDLTAEMALA